MNRNKITGETYNEFLLDISSLGVILIVVAGLLKTIGFMVVYKLVAGIATLCIMISAVSVIADVGGYIIRFFKRK